MVSELELPELLIIGAGKIKTQNGIEYIKLWDFQREYLRVRREHKKVAILKSRDIGSSTIAVLEMTAKVLLNGGDFLIASYKRESAMYLLESAKIFIESIKNVLPQFVNLKQDRRSGLVVNGYHIDAMEMSERVGRSFRFKYLLGSEMAFWENAQESWQALQGAGVKDSEIVIESTPNPSRSGKVFEELLNSEEFYKMVVDFRANPAHDEEWEKERRKTLTALQFAQEYECSLIKDAGNLFRREWFEIVEDYPRDCKKIRYWDLASTKKEESDYTAGLLLGEKNGIFYVLDVKHFKGTPLEVENMIRQTALLDGNIPIYIEQEPGASGVTLIDHYRREVLRGFDFHSDKKSTSKELRARPVSAAAQAGNIKILKASWNKEFLDEIELFPNDIHDDQVDALSGAFNKITFGNEVVQF